MASRAQNYNENFSSVQHQTKNVDSSRKHHTKSNVLGEIKNVIHNQGNITTPLKPDQLPTKNLPFSHLSSSAVKVKDKQAFTHLQHYAGIQQKSPHFDDHNEIKLLDYFDFRGQCCGKTKKRDQEIWSEMNMFDDSFLNKIINNDQSDEEEETFGENPLISDEIDEDVTFFQNMGDELNSNYWPDSIEVEENADIHEYIEKPHAVDFNFFI